ncbi:MAG: sugar ABC transporter substrate-binding protein [Acidimicrobiia bacterium]|nr:sugar ABC transporter substrate-binding protein [Acidimicrobiia bacterium]MYC84440.1 sugar ABC transporter substrate-binding protein [Acidimicrobiia bacterium]
MSGASAGRACWFPGEDRGAFQRSEGGLMRKLKLLAVVLALSLVAAACGGDDDEPAETTAAPAATEATTAAAPETTAAAPAAMADMPAVCQGYDGSGITIGYGDLTAGIPFVTQVLDNLMEVAEACNVEVLYADNNLDGETALENARTFTLAEVDGVIQFQIDASIEGALCDEMRANDPNLPVIAIDIAHPSCALFFGADNGYAGELAGQALGQWAQENWGCGIDMVVTMETFVVGQVNIDRANGMVRGISQVCTGLDYGDFENWSPDATGIVTRIDGGGTTDGAFPKVLDTFTANPGKRIAVVSLNDDMGLAALAAARELGIEDMVVYASQGADATIHQEIRTNPQYIGSTGYFPETYGNYVIPAILAMIAGDPVPDPLYVNHIFVSADNIDQFYPADGTAAPAAMADMPAVCQGYDGSGITIGYGDLTAGIPFVTQVLDNLMEVAEACNVEVLYADNNLDGETALENARTFTLAEVDGVIQFQIDASIEGALCDEMRANDPNLPVIAIDIAHPSCALFFGADNGYAGELAGQALGQWAQENWGCGIDMVVTMETFVVGQVNIDRANGMVRGISQVCTGLDYGDFENWSPDATGIVTRIDGGGTTDGAFPKVLDTFTANPGKRIAVVSLNDDMGLAALAAARELGIEDMVVYASQGADATIHQEIRTNPQYIGSTGYFPETYGNYVIPAILAMIAGDPVPDPLYVNHIFVSADNIDQFYPG